jgi:hypothetical protein
MSPRFKYRIRPEAAEQVLRLLSEAGMPFVVDSDLTFEPPIPSPGGKGQPPVQAKFGTLRTRFGEFRADLQTTSQWCRFTVNAAKREPGAGLEISSFRFWRERLVSWVKAPFSRRQMMAEEEILELMGEVESVLRPVLMPNAERELQP